MAKNLAKRKMSSRVVWITETREKEDSDKGNRRMRVGVTRKVNKTEKRMQQ